MGKIKGNVSGFPWGKRRKRRSHSTHGTSNPSHALEKIRGHYDVAFQNHNRLKEMGNTPNGVCTYCTLCLLCQGLEMQPQRKVTSSSLKWKTLISGTFQSLFRFLFFISAGGGERRFTLILKVTSSNKYTPLNLVCLTSHTKRIAVSTLFVIFRVVSDIVVLVFFFSFIQKTQ